MNNKKRFLIFCVLAILSFTSMSLEVWANNIEDARARQRELSEYISTERQELVNTRSQIRSLNVELEALEYELSLAVDLLEAINFDLELTRLELENAKIGLEEAKEARDRQFEAFITRSRHIYMNGWMGYVDAILNAESFTDFLNRIEHVNRIVEFDRNLVQELKRAEENISSHVDTIQTQEDDLLFLEGIQIERMRGYDDLLEQKVATRMELEHTEAGQVQSLEQLEEDHREIARIIQEHEAEQRRQELAARARGQAEVVQRPFVHDGQDLQWPLPGHTRVTSHFGNRSDPFTTSTAFHSGIDVGAPMGVNILAAESGTVIFSGWMGGYGNTIIVDHGGGMHTMYAHASSLLVRNGQNVNRGQAIARVGSTGRSTGNHLHFEVRINGSVTNPLNFTSPN